MNQHILQRLRETRILENYSFMTSLNVLSALIGFVIYPYVIRKIGSESYGVYPFALAIVFYFQTIIDFGFDSPSAKAIVENRNSEQAKSLILSKVFSAKLFLWLICSILFGIIIFVTPDLRQNKLIFILTYAQTFASVLYPTWYFQGMKNMRIVTYVNLILRILTIPFILLFVQSAESLWLYVTIVSLSMIIGGVVAMLYIILHDHLTIRLLSPRYTKKLFSDGLPFFITSLTGQLKEGLMTIIVRYCFGYTEVTLFDIAKKIVTIPRMFTQNINSALFPEVIQNPSLSRVQKILKYDRLIGLIVTLSVIVVSYPLVVLLFSKEMIGAVPLTMILSWSLYTWLVVGAYLNFVFIPHNKYYLISLNQIVALVTCLLMTCGLMLWNNIIIIALSLFFSGFCEILFCKYITRQQELLS